MQDQRADVTTRRSRGDVVAVVAAALLLGAAIWVPQQMSPADLAKLHADTAPLYALYRPHWSPASFTSLALLVLAVAFLPRLAARLPWRALLVGTWAACATWSMSVNLVDGWTYGFATKQADGNEYTPFADTVTSVPAFLSSFDARILEGVPGSLPTHVSGHPPGATLLFVALERVGLGGPVAAAWFCTLAGTFAVVAVLVTLRTLASEPVARRAAPFLVLFPGVVWITVSADAVFMAWTAWGIALLALAAVRPWRSGWWLALGGGLLLGYGVFLSYGFVVMGLPAVAVLVAARRAWPVLVALPAALAVAAVFWASGFFWLDGYHLVVERYYQGIASERPYSYWVWGNLAALVCVVGFATAAGVQRVLRPSLLRARDGLSLLVLSGVGMVAVADLSALSKAETERIWLPFAIWVLCACAALPDRGRRVALTVQGLLPLAVVHLVLTNW